MSQWRREPGQGRKKPKYSYRTVDELKAKGYAMGKSMAAPPTELAQVKVIDMTGREHKVYSSYSQMSNKHSVPEEPPLPPAGKEQKSPGFALPELEHNLQLLIDLTEQEILQGARRLQHERDVVVSLSHESETLAETLSQEEGALERLGRVLELVEQCERRMSLGPGSTDEPLSLEDCAQLFERLQGDFYEEYKAFGLADLAVAMVHPLLKEHFRHWEPLKVRLHASCPLLMEVFPSGYLQPGARENVAYLTHTERRKDFQYEAMQERREAESVAQRGIGAATIPTNFKDLIQAKAEEHNIVFMPVVGKRHEGKQLYTFGRIVIYIDRGVVFVQGEKTWVPTSLQSLIDMAK
ncbi:UNVERIFIED_CONTAM: hypothetical protein FKN15_030041 [Acipenser sinensis]